MGNYIPTCPWAHTHVHPYSSPHPLILILLLEWVWVDSIIWKLPGTSKMQCAAWVKNDHPKWVHLPWHTIFLFSDLSLTPSIEYSLNNLVPIHKTPPSEIHTFLFQFLRWLSGWMKTAYRVLGLVGFSLALLDDIFCSPGHLQLKLIWNKFWWNMIWPPSMWSESDSIPANLAPVWLMWVPWTPQGLCHVLQ